MEHKNVISVEEGCTAHALHETAKTAGLMEFYAREIHEILQMIRVRSGNGAHQIDPEGHRREFQPVDEGDYKGLIEANQRLKELLPQLRELHTEIHCVGITALGGF